MADREKVVKGLESLHERLLDAATRDKIAVLDATMVADALALLKEQEAKTGKWIEKDGYDGDVYYDCSACGESWVMIDGTPQENGMLYCPHCGAKMEGW